VKTFNNAPRVSPAFTDSIRVNTAETHSMCELLSAGVAWRGRVALNAPHAIAEKSCLRSILRPLRCLTILVDLGTLA
jgi:hypothetical protein